MQNMRKHFPESEKLHVIGAYTSLTIPRKLDKQTALATESEVLSLRHSLC